MYLGFDLGTSNSAVAGNKDSDLRIFKTSEGADVLPSVIYIDRRGHKFVGVRAYEQGFRSPENVARAFKRLMGTKSPIELASGHTMTPEEASAEILKTLFGQMATETGEADVIGSIVTIPAAFNQMQSEATLRAANGAGLDRVGLLQEPIAAALATISHTKNKSGQFLVYDLGGGTFDLALVQSLSGAVNIVGHEGINMLGGLDFDRSILNSIVRPWLLDKFDLPDNFQKSEKYLRVIRMASWAAERAKIELSSHDKAVIFASDEDVRVKDEVGGDIFVEVNINRSQLEDLISEQIDQTIALSRKILKDNGYSHEDIDRIVFIGGPTKMPSIREKIPRELGIPADLQTDPMTAVAIGASIFAESREWADGTTKRKTARGSVTATGPIDIRYDYTARTSEDRARIKVVLPEGTTDGGYELQVDSQEGWTSGRKSVESRAVIEVPLDSIGENVLRITVFDASGAPVPDASTRITITRTHATSAGIPASLTISVSVVEEIDGTEHNVLEPLVEKGTLLPAKGEKVFLAAKGLRAGVDGHIDLNLYQQVPGVPEPELNLFVGSFRIDSTDIPSGLAVRKGDQITVGWAMDDSGLLGCTIEIPSVSQSFDTGRWYADTAGHQNFEGEDGTQLAERVFSDAYNDLAQMEEALGGHAKIEVANLQNKLDQQREALDLAYDAEGRRSVTEEARQIRQSLSRLRHAPENRAIMLKQRVDGLCDQFDKLIRENADARSSAQFDQLAETARSAVENGDDASLHDAERSCSEMDRISFRELNQQPAYLIYVLKLLSEERYLASDKPLFDQLVEQGLTAISANDMDSVRRVIAEILQNRFNVGSADESVTMLAGLMRS